MITSNPLETKEKRRRLRLESTSTETELWLCLKNRQLSGYKFRRQFGVGPYILDFYRPTKKLVIEIDGGIHNDAEQILKDKIRTEYLEGLGLGILRFTNEQVWRNKQGVILAIENALEG